MFSRYVICNSNSCAVCFRQVLFVKLSFVSKSKSAFNAVIEFDMPALSLQTETVYEGGWKLLVIDLPKTKEHRIIYC